MKNINRRNFIAGALMTGGALATGTMAGCSKSSSASTASSETEWSKEADIVIVGAGGGGLAAAVESANAGKSVIVVEAMETAAQSNSALCGGMIQGACTSVQEQAGVSDSMDEFDKYLAAVGEGYENPDLRRLYAENSGSTIDWLVEQGVDLQPQMLTTYGSMVDYYAFVTTPVPRVHMVSSMAGSGFTEVLLRNAKDKGASFMLGTQATELVQNDAGEVIGIKVKAGRKEVGIKASCAVILNTGGFTRNQDMVKSFMSPAVTGMRSDRPLLASYGSPWQKGDGIVMALKAGAKLVNPWLAYNMAPGIEEGTEDNSGSFIVTAGIYVSTEGKRFVNESGQNNPGSAPGEVTMSKIWKQSDGSCWVLWDQSIVDAAAAAKTGVGVLATGSLDLSKEVSAGYVRKADSVEALARQIGVDPATLSQTVAGFNAGVATGTDAFGRADGMALATSPYYAGKVIAVSPDTAGGIGVNTDLQVLTFAGDVIPRLYAVGNTVGGFKGKVNAGCGQALGWTYTSGLLAARHACGLDPLS